MANARLVSVNVGLPRDVEWQGRTVHTAVWKSPVAGRVRVGRLNVVGDGQGDLAGHGGEQRAVFVYQLDSYRYWAKELSRSDFVHGQFGENFTVEGLADATTCIGDRFRIGSALFEVTQPRVTCYRIGMRMNEPRMPALLTGRGRPGFYFRVIEEGEVGAGDAIVKVASGDERMSVERINALLYLPRHPREELERALRIEALSEGWRASFRALLEGGPGNAGLEPAAAGHGAAPGFFPMRVAAIVRESADVLSFVLEATSGHSLAMPRPGQFVVLRLRPDVMRTALFRSYSLSGAPSADQYRISVKIESHGAGGAYLAGHVREGDVLDVSSSRGAFVLSEGEGPVVLSSAGIGVTPVLAMLHALVATGSARPVFWLHGSRNGELHPFAMEVRELLARLPNGRSFVVYSRPRAEDVIGRDFDRVGHLDVSIVESLGVPREADFYLCGPTAFLNDVRDGLARWGVARSRIHSEMFGGGESSTPGVVGRAKRAPHPPEGAGAGPDVGPLVSFARSGLVVRWDRKKYRSILELAEACDVPVRWSCRTGVCHSCESGLVSGTLLYDPEPLEPPAPGNALICCSQPEGDVVVDL
ncbi:Flavohemoprotein [Labilithrix luteola]|uniref:nitric oxide dioxygenase n=1 Tax=Labilithrix luteola TaxID=1391654 RepID=A0A0K1QBW5_9BACT|nr:MOSC and FAD-binding oxidoreductase domain-containing protein [Labilithrix luteola]AKV02920.1 Flavohemoprotein [Labilithrix luteola]